jgi:hypothetical protein
MSGIAVRINHVDRVVMAGWEKTGKGQYRHATGRAVIRRDSGLWEVIGGADDGNRYGTMHVAMYYAGK